MDPFPSQFEVWELAPLYNEETTLRNQKLWEITRRVEGDRRMVKEVGGYRRISHKHWKKSKIFYQKKIHSMKIFRVIFLSVAPFVVRKQCSETP